jgi:hypothetical protein
VLIGVGLHPFLGRWTTGTLVLLFVMLNFTGSGGVFAPELQPGFFAALTERRRAAVAVAPTPVPRPEADTVRDPEDDGLESELEESVVVG